MANQTSKYQSDCVQLTSLLQTVFDCINPLLSRAEVARALTKRPDLIIVGSREVYAFLGFEGQALARRPRGASTTA
jgi:hypothetical protein